MLILSIECNAIRLGGPAHGIVTKTVHKSHSAGGGEGERSQRVISGLGVVAVVDFGSNDMKLQLRVII